MTPDVQTSLRVRWRFWLAVSVLLVLLGGGLWLVIDQLTQATVTLDVSGQVWRKHTRAGTVQEVLDEAGVLLDPEDVVWPDQTTALEDGMRITVRKAVAVAVEVNGEVYHVRTQAVHPLDVLAEKSIPVGKYDVIRVDGQEFSPERLAEQVWDELPVSIHVLRSATIYVVDGERTQVLHTTQLDVGRALDNAGVMLYLADNVTPGLSTPVEDGMMVRIRRSHPFTLVVDGRRTATRAYGPTVGDALAVVGAAPVGQDYTVPPSETPFEPGMVIRVVRVVETLVTKRELIPYSTTYRFDPTLAPGTQRVIQAGQDGVRERQVLVRYEDGVEVQRTEQAESILQPATPCLVAVGTPGE